MAQSQEFRKSKTGLALSVITLTIGLIGLVVSVAIGDFNSSLGFVGISSLGVFLTFMQRRSAAYNDS